MSPASFKAAHSAGADAGNRNVRELAPWRLSKIAQFEWAAGMLRIFVILHQAYSKQPGALRRAGFSLSIGALQGTRLRPKQQLHVDYVRYRTFVTVAIHRKIRS